jgi:TolB-like protein
MAGLKITRWLLATFLLFAATGAQAADSQTIAVLYFENNSLAQRNDMAPLSKGLADMFITELGKISAFQVVERNKLQELLEEMKLAQAGLVSGKSAQEVGKMLGAQQLLLGSFMMMLDKKMRIDVRIVQVESGITVKAEEATGSPKDLYKLVATLIVKISKDLNVQLSRAEAAKLATVDNTSFDAALYYAKGLEYEDAQDYKNAAHMYEAALKQNSAFTKARERLTAVKSK